MKKVLVYTALTVVFLSAPEYASACLNCNCYFSVDCTRRPGGAGQICNYRGNISQQTGKCKWRTPKPTAAAPTGCTADTTSRGRCDGRCEDNYKGSGCGNEDPQTLVAAVQFWGAAMIDVAEAGGGLIDPELAQLALDTPSDFDCSLILGRHTGSQLIGLAGEDFIVEPPGRNDGPPPLEWQEHWVADLSGNTCLVAAQRLVVDALAAEIKATGAGDNIIDAIPELCPEVFDSIVSCADSDDITCTRNAVHNLAEFLALPPAPVVPDCNANGLIDTCEIASGESWDFNEDSIPDECQGECGNNLLEVGEECDGTDDWACREQCLPDCTCEFGTGVPALSEWGLIVFTVLVLTAGTIVIRRWWRLREA